MSIRTSSLTRAHALFSALWAGRDRRDVAAVGTTRNTTTPSSMYAHRSFAPSAFVKEVIQQDPDHVAGLSADGAYAWLAADSRLCVWRATDGSYAAITSLSCPGAPGRSKDHPMNIVVFSAPRNIVVSGCVRAVLG
jgi:hypothetical protein